MPPPCSPAPRPYTTVILAMSADGKISDRDRQAARFSSAADLHHLETQIAQADGVLFGANTLRAYGTCLTVRQPALLGARSQRQQPPQPIQMVCSGSGKLDPKWRFFQQAVPRWLITTALGAKRWQGQAAFEQVLTLSASSPSGWRVMAQTLREQGVETLALLGGGTLVAAWLAAGLVDELYLTVCPLLMGGAGSPTPVDGAGQLMTAPWPLTLISAKTVGSEVFLHYRYSHDPGD
ncbi:MAG: RibD family protein [Cyanobacteria bacterium]|nr:RibD family protein [Cyanobacteriota bacterium]MDA0866427.1 RibD family protein [Cyanobacteriota bacterium]